MQKTLPFMRIYMAGCLMCSVRSMFLSMLPTAHTVASSLNCKPVAPNFRVLGRPKPTVLGGRQCAICT